MKLEKKIIIEDIEYDFMKANADTELVCCTICGCRVKFNIGNIHNCEMELCTDRVLEIEDIKELIIKYLDK